ncbi:MAG TPA: Gfo/Idh/MocA family oxidoreductase [Chryseolinea sp.]|nr:Gfo/Idh/MocA family oxidoreductase [Chryseolinea sp.]
MRTHDSTNINRRKFLGTSGAAVIGSALALNAGLPNTTRASGTANTLKVGLIGCGGRGTGAAAQAVQADPDAILTAMGDVFADRLEESYAGLLEVVPTKLKVDKASRFVGFDAYKKVIDSGVDVVILATPPGFRPDHLAAAIDAGKHVFCEKPVAVDAAGIRKVLEAVKKAKAKRLSLVSGFTFRYDYSKRALFDRVLGGDIGDVVAVSSTRNGSDLWYHPRQASWTEMEYQMRNWYYQNWLSGDYLVEMIVHSIDLMMWAMGDKLPAKATGSGGRQVRVDEKYGNIYDHFAIEYEYDNGTRAMSFSRQQPGCSNRNTVEIVGTAGSAYVNMGTSNHEITGKNKWIYSGEKNNPYQTQHDELFASIRNGKPMNDGERMANSTMAAILGRMAAYSGQTLLWNEALASTQTIGPAFHEYNWDFKFKGLAIAIPGITKVI